MRFYDTFNHVDAVPVSTTLCLHTISGPKFPSNLFPPIFMWSRKAKKKGHFKVMPGEANEPCILLPFSHNFYYNSNYHNLNSASSLFVLQLNCTSQSALTAIHVLVQRRNDLPISFFVSYTVSTQWTTMTTIF